MPVKFASYLFRNRKYRMAVPYIDNLFNLFIHPIIYINLTALVAKTALAGKSHNFLMLPTLWAHVFKKAIARVTTP